MRLTLGIFLLSAQLLLPAGAVQAAGMRASASGTTSAAKKKSSSGSGSGQLQEQGQGQEAGTATTRSKHLKKKSENHNQKEPNPANPWCHNGPPIFVIVGGVVSIIIGFVACCMWVNKRGTST
eukprot:g2923.t1